MSTTHFMLDSAFMLSMLGLSIHRTHLVSALLCIEGMMLSLYIILMTMSSMLHTPTFSPAPIMLLSFSACEASLGLALLVATSRTHGSDHLQNLNLLQC